ncbi:MAG: sulfurtransferase [Beggiatoa sp. IS2]|nr:MAG: sulfurtransferase [Beggiatoa sp. IS2]
MSGNQVRSLAPGEAWQLLQDDPKATMIDVRSSMEFLFVGHPTGAVLVAWIDEPEWDINPNFVTEVHRAVLNNSKAVEYPTEAILQNPVLLICRSGVRSLDAGKVLCEASFTQVYNVLEGFEGPLDAEHHRGTLGGWRYHGLPWEQC